MEEVARGANKHPRQNDLFQGVYLGKHHDLQLLRRQQETMTDLHVKICKPRTSRRQTEALCLDSWFVWGVGGGLGGGGIFDLIYLHNLIEHFCMQAVMWAVGTD